MGWFVGYRTFITSVCIGLTAFAKAQNYIDEETFGWLMGIFNALAIYFLKAGQARVEQQNKDIITEQTRSVRQSESAQTEIIVEQERVAAELKNKPKPAPRPPYKPVGK